MIRELLKFFRFVVTMEKSKVEAVGSEVSDNKGLKLVAVCDVFMKPQPPTYSQIGLRHPRLSKPNNAAPPRILDFSRHANLAAKLQLRLRIHTRRQHTGTPIPYA